MPLVMGFFRKKVRVGVIYYIYLYISYFFIYHNKLLYNFLLY
nr:MAG TPA: hypothetical protein [Caudoviricetes sp.]